MQRANRNLAVFSTSVPSVWKFLWRITDMFISSFRGGEVIFSANTLLSGAHVIYLAWRETQILSAGFFFTRGYWCEACHRLRFSRDLSCKSSQRQSNFTLYPHGWILFFIHLPCITCSLFSMGYPRSRLNPEKAQHFMVEYSGPVPMASNPLPVDCSLVILTWI